MCVCERERERERKRAGEVKGGGGGGGNCYIYFSVYFSSRFCVTVFTEEWALQESPLIITNIKFISLVTENHAFRS